MPEDQAAQNRSTAGQWSLYSSHRASMERLLVPPRMRELRLCVLGAGNCNDLDLNWLLRAYREVHLVDIDAPALEAAVRRQKVAQGGRLVCRAPVDLTAAADLFASWDGRAPSAARAEAYCQRLHDAPLPGLGHFDRVLSPCVLSQLIFPVRESMGAQHADYPRVRAALRTRHLRTMRHLLAPGGEGMLVLDLVSSSSFEDLARVEAGDLRGFMSRMIERKKCFRGLEPDAIAATFRDEPVLAGRLDELEFSEPWLWHLSLQRSFVVYAARFRWRGAAATALSPRPGLLGFGALIPGAGAPGY